MAAARSLCFFVLYIAYLVLVMEPLQWLVIAPLVTLLPSSRSGVMGAWILGQARFVLWLSQWMAGWRLTVEGAIPPGTCLVVMNHQSVMDVALGLSLVRGPCPLIPTRARYRWGVPGASTLMRLARYPFVSERPALSRASLLTLRAAADAVGRGERSLIIFPEGHRSRNKSILPFMTSGLRLFLRRAPRRPVYVVVLEGFRHLHSLRDVALRLAGTRAHAAIRGPFQPPTDPARLDAFIEELRAIMVRTLAEIPDPPLETARRVAPSPRLV